MSTVATSGQALSAILVCAAMGMLGQGIRAVVGLKKASAAASTPGPQSEFSLAYLGLSFLIGAVAGVLAGFTIGLDKFLSIDLGDQKLLLGIAAAGYVGADFIENAMSIVIKAPSAGADRASDDAGDEPATPAVAPDGGAKADRTALMDAIRDLGGKIDDLGGGQSRAPLLETKSSSGIVSPSSALPQPAGRRFSPDEIARTLHAALPHVDVAVWAQALVHAFDTFELNSVRRVAAALGQFSEEARSDFHEIRENLTYTTPARLVAVFPSLFPTEAEAGPYVGKPEKLANHVYAHKIGNGDEASGDGYRFRGRGLIQLTGRGNYAEFGQTIGKSAEEAADFCETIEGAAFSGCWFLAAHRCLELADDWRLTELTSIVNRKRLGLDRRVATSNAALATLQRL